MASQACVMVLNRIPDMTLPVEIHSLDFFDGEQVHFSCSAASAVKCQIVMAALGEGGGA